MTNVYLKTPQGISVYRGDLPHLCAVDVLTEFAENYKRFGWSVKYIGAEHINVTSRNPLQHGCELYLKEWGQ